MQKSYLSLFFLSLSTLMMLGHSIIPHHHHSHIEDFGFSGHFHQEFSSEIESSHHHTLLENFFSLVSHGHEGMECISCPNMDETFNNEYFDFYSVHQDEIRPKFPLIEEEKFFTEYNQDPFIFSYFPPGGLRAPPAYL